MFTRIHMTPSNHSMKTFNDPPPHHPHPHPILDHPRATSVQALADMPPRADEELDAVTLHNSALVHMASAPAAGFEKLSFLLGAGAERMGWGGPP